LDSIPRVHHGEISHLSFRHQCKDGLYRDAAHANGAPVAVDEFDSAGYCKAHAADYTPGRAGCAYNGVMTGIAERIDHTLLKIDRGTSLDTFREGARFVLEHRLRAFVVPPSVVRTLASEFPSLSLATVVSYPLGCDLLPVKLAQLRAAAADGAAEVDAVLNLLGLLAVDGSVSEETSALCREAKQLGIGLKLIIETPILTPELITRACALLQPLDFLAIKTSTGYGREPTKLEDVRLIKQLVGDAHLVKASGGIGTREEAEGFIAAGADILGTSSTTAILSGTASTGETA
jgi:deoxyribose-phosphate aldolase